MKLYWTAFWVKILFVPIFAQWQNISIETQNELRNVHFLNAETGWIVGNGSTVLKTTDGGNNWLAQTPPVNDDYLSLFFIDEKLGWIGGNNGSILKTTDGGKNWTVQNISNSNSIIAMYFVDKSTGFLLVNKWNNERYFWVYKTTNGGLSWEIKVEKKNQCAINLCFYDQLNGWIVGTSGLYLRTFDSGENWEFKYAGSSYWLFDVYFTDELTGWISGGNNSQDIILKTVDGGVSWSKIRNSKDNGTLAGLTFADPNNGWACGINGVILRTENGGKTWIKENTSVYNTINDIFFCENILYAVGENGIILKSKFSPGEKSISLLKPSINDKWEVASMQNILWKSNYVVDVTIQYSFNNGASWNTVVESYPSTGIYSWKVPNIISTQAKIRIIDKSNSKIFSESDLFKIIN